MNGLSDKSHAAHGFIQFLFYSELSVSHHKIATMKGYVGNTIFVLFNQYFDSNCIK